MSEAWARLNFPSLGLDPGFAVTSPADTDYNCIAWAAEKNDVWLWPLPAGALTRAGVSWPAEIPTTGTLGDFIALFESFGYEQCADTTHEAGYAKVAIYTHANGSPTHAARQLPAGDWTSKLGRGVDVSHSTPLGVEGALYGSVAIVMRRTLADG